MGRSQSHEGRNEKYPAIVRHGLRQRLDFFRASNQTQSVAQPLDDGATYEDAALEGILGRVFYFPSNGCNQPIGRRDRATARILQHEASGAVGVLGQAGSDAALANQGSLLIAGNAGEWNALQSFRSGRFSVDLAGGSHDRHHGERDSKQIEKFAVPGPGMHVKEHGARGVAGVGRVNSAARQLPEQPAIDRAEGELARFSIAARAGNVVQDPRDFAGREIGIDQQAGALLDQRTVTFTPEALAEISGAPVLPDDRVVDGFPSLAIPHDRGLALVGDADRSDFAWWRASLSQDLESHCDLGGSDLLGIVLDPPGLRKDLIKFPLGGRANGSFLIEQESSRTGCALVER